MFRRPCPDGVSGYGVNGLTAFQENAMTALNRRSLLLGLSAVGASALVSRAYAQAPAGPFKLDPLPYATNKNEPHIDAMTMEIHHGRHHAAFINNLNGAVGQYGDLAKKPLHEILANLNSVPEAVRATVRNSGGGNANHAMFWQIMGGAGGTPKGDLKAAIDRDLAGMEKFQETFNGAGGRVFGSGWVFVTVAKDGKLAIESKPNQDTPLMDGKMVLMGNDVWEHAYYLKYQNRRPDYLKAWWNVLDWNKIEARYANAKAGKLTI
jgi:Fe-Mn family superoxide dismutase